MTQIKRLRQKTGLTQEKLSKLLNVSRSTVAMWETSSQRPDYDTLEQLRKTFGVPHDFILGQRVFRNWDNIMDRYGDVSEKLKTLIPPSLCMPSFCEEKNLVAWLDIQYYEGYNRDELQLARFFSFAINEVKFLDDGTIDISFTDEFKAIIKREEELRRKGNDLDQVAQTPVPGTGDGRAGEFAALFSQLTKEQQTLVLAQLKGILSDQ